MVRTILRLPAVIARTGLSRSTIYRLIAAGEFPSPRSIGARAVGWLESDVSAWVDKKFPLVAQVEASKDRAGLDNQGHIVSVAGLGEKP